MIIETSNGFDVKILKAGIVRLKKEVENPAFHLKYNYKFENCKDMCGEYYRVYTPYIGVDDGHFKPKYKNNIKFFIFFIDEFFHFFSIFVESII